MGFSCSSFLLAAVGLSRRVRFFCWWQGVSIQCSPAACSVPRSETGQQAAESNAAAATQDSQETEPQAMTNYRPLSPTETPRNGDQAKHRTALGSEWANITERKGHVQRPQFEYRRPLDVKPEKSGVTIGNCRVSRVIDGDTIELEVTRRVRVRLLDCWAPEKSRTKHASEKPLGLKAKAALESMAPIDSECVLRIPTDGDLDIGDGLTFGRVVGDVWIDNQMTLSEQMRVSGYTYATKADLEAFLTAQDSRQANEQYESL